MPAGRAVAAGSHAPTTTPARSRPTSRHGRAPLRLSGPHAILDLQRRAGNRAVATAIETGRLSVTHRPGRSSQRAAYQHHATRRAAAPPTGSPRRPLPPPTVSRTVQRGFFGGLAKGAVGWIKDTGRGLKRTAKGLRVWNPDALAEQGQEDERAFGVFKKVVSGGISVLSNIVEITMGAYLTWKMLPAKVKSLVQQKAAQTGLEITEGMAGKWVGKQIRNRVARAIAQRVAQTALYRMLARRIGVAAGASATGAGLPLGMLSVMGLIEKASMAAKRLRRTFPALYRRLDIAQLEMAWFLVEPFVDRIKQAVAKHVVAALGRMNAQGRVPVDWKRDRVPVDWKRDRVPIRTSKRTPIRAGGGR